MRLVSFYFIIIFSLIASNFCSNPIQKKLKELQKCKATLKYSKIIQAKMLLFPPVPKIFFKAGVDISNNNEVEVAIDKFDFTVYLNNPEEGKKLPLAYVTSPESYKIPPLTAQTIEIDLETLFEKSKGENVLEIASTVMKKGLTTGELELLIEGTIEFSTSLGNFNIPFSQITKSKIKF
ncbi:MAG: LEA type 2 family protein [Leptospiraceae bacterium]|nr:LEA type 2 family protein [Leptospiraceae bacterium]MCK6382520.1 LEA type 2 family protein [Leptospiraceae bacterium]NUM42524.1 LEA type 2 family protein [Leptospiraceae bacterium]